MKNFLLIFLVGLLAVAPPVAFGGGQGRVAVLLPIVMYHQTSPRHAGVYSITPSELEADLAYIKLRGYTTITVADLIAYRERAVALPDKPIMLTFDDAYTNNYYYAVPLLRKHGMRAVFSAVGRYTDDNYDKAGRLCPTHSHMTYEQLLEASADGTVEVQNHTYDLHRCTAVRRAMSRVKGESERDYKRKITDDLTRMHTRLRQQTGIECTAIAYPYGVYNSLTTEVVKEIGYVAAFTCTAGQNYITPTSDLYHLRRHNRPSGKPSHTFFDKIMEN